MIIEYLNLLSDNESVIFMRSSTVYQGSLDQSKSLICRYAGINILSQV